MIQCPKCSAENTLDSRFCKSCGQEVSSVSQMPTIEAPEQESPPAPIQSPHVGRIVSSDSVPGYVYMNSPLSASLLNSRSSLLL